MFLSVRDINPDALQRHLSAKFTYGGFVDKTGGKVKTNG